MTDVRTSDQGMMMDPRTSAQDMIRCDLCDTAMVQMYCDTCRVNLCKACVGEHMLSDESKKHEIKTFLKFTPSTLNVPLMTKTDVKCTVIRVIFRSALLALHQISI
jgi:hypothetical protein